MDQDNVFCKKKMLKGKNQMPVSIRYISCRKLMKKWIFSMEHTGKYRDVEMDKTLFYKDSPSYQYPSELEVMLVSNVDYKMYSYELKFNNLFLLS